MSKNYSTWEKNVNNLVVVRNRTVELSAI